MIEQSEQRNPVEVLAEEFLDRRRRGEAATVQDYATAHPEFSAEIRSLFPAMLAMEKFKTTRLSSSSARIDLLVEAPEQLGDFRIIREIGRGGMGVVYEAEQQSLERRVAVKLFPPQALADLRQLKRFHIEARTAASLHHTNIVPVFGVGEQDGLHYYVMQCIHGKGLDQYVQPALTEPDPTVIGDIRDGTPSLAFSNTSTNPLADGDSEIVAAATVDTSPIPRPAATEADDVELQVLNFRSVADIGIQVADALAYAHAQGVLHRDIKPGNLMLDPKGTVWITDFGLATIMEAEELNQAPDVVGTLRFMAPEHLNGKQDARSDIYSLGVTMYELLTLKPAFEEKSRAKLISRIMKGDVVAPATLRPDIPRDLAAIVMKAMACDVAHRYDNADELASDLRRFVEGRPVRARKINPAATFWRWMRRNPVVSSLSSALVLVAVSSIVLISAKWREAVVQGARAEGNLSLALESMDQILERFASNWMAHPMPADEGGEGPADVEFQLAVTDYNAAVLQNALKFYDRFARQNSTNPQLKRHTAKVHRRVGDIYQRLGQNFKAERAYRTSLEILSSDDIAQNPAVLVERASTTNQLGLAMYSAGRFDESEKEFQRAKQMLSTTGNMEAPDCRAELARTENNLGQVLQMMRRHNEARRSHREAVDILEELVAEQPKNADYRLSLARAYRIYYPFASFGPRRGNGGRIRAAGIAILEELVAEFPQVPDYQCELSEMLATRVSRSRRQRGEVQSAEEQEHALLLARSLSEKHPSIPRYRTLLARLLKERAEALSREDDHVAAEELLRESVTLYRSLSTDSADVPAYHLFLAWSLRDLADSLHELQEMGAARAAIVEGIEELQEYVSMRPESSFGNRTLAGLYEDLAEVHDFFDDTMKAEVARQKATQLRERFGMNR